MQAQPLDTVILICEFGLTIVPCVGTDSAITLFPYSAVWTYVVVPTRKPTWLKVIAACAMVCPTIRGTAIPLLAGSPTAAGAVDVTSAGLVDAPLADTGVTPAEVVGPPLAGVGVTPAEVVGTLTTSLDAPQDVSATVNAIASSTPRERRTDGCVVP